MDYLRVLLVPFQPTILWVLAPFTVLFALCERAGWVGAFPALLLCIWLLRYCYALLEELADGASEAPVMSIEMLSLLKFRPWMHVGLCAAGAWLCRELGGIPGSLLGALLLGLLPVSIAVLGQGAPAYQAINPLALVRVMRGLGSFYPMILGLIGVYVITLELLSRAGLWPVAWFGIALIMTISIFAAIGSALYARRHWLGLQPRRSPEHIAARHAAERERQRARMLDEVFQLARVGRHIDATLPLAAWFVAHGEHVADDARLIAARALQWNLPAALEAIGSTLVRHVLRNGRPELALSIYDSLCEQVPALTLDTRENLMAIAAYAESTGRARHAKALRDSAAHMRFWN